MLMFNIQPLPSTFGPTPIFLNDRHVLCCDIVLTSPPQLVCVCVCVCVCYRSKCMSAQEGSSSLGLHEVKLLHVFSNFTWIVDLTPTPHPPPSCAAHACRWQRILPCTVSRGSAVSHNTTFQRRVGVIMLLSQRQRRRYCNMFCICLLATDTTNGP